MHQHQIHLELPPWMVGLEVHHTELHIAPVGLGEHHIEVHTGGQEVEQHPKIKKIVGAEVLYRKHPQLSGQVVCHAKNFSKSSMVGF